MGTYVGTVTLEERQGSNLYTSTYRTSLGPPGNESDICKNGAMVPPPGTEIYNFRVKDASYPIVAVQNQDGSLQFTISELKFANVPPGPNPSISLSFIAFPSSEGKLVVDGSTIVAESLGTLNYGTVETVEYNTYNLDCGLYHISGSDGYLEITINSTTLVWEPGFNTTLESQTLGTSNITVTPVAQAPVPAPAPPEGGYGSSSSTYTYRLPSGEYVVIPIESPRPPAPPPDPYSPPSYGSGYPSAPGATTPSAGGHGSSSSSL